MVRLLFFFSVILFCFACERTKDRFTNEEKAAIREEIQNKLDLGVQATREKDIDLYMELLPKDLVIYDESGEVITREMQRNYALRDWAIIDTTLSISATLDSIHYLSRDSLQVFTSQRWERMMFRQDHVTLDTVLTTQRHLETWKKSSAGWLGYSIEELGGEIYINGELYSP